MKPHPIEQNDKTWTFITEPLRSFEKEIQVGLAADAQIHIVLTGDKEKADSAYEISKYTYLYLYNYIALLKAVELFTLKKDCRCINTHPYSLCVTSHDTILSACVGRQSA